MSDDQPADHQATRPRGGDGRYVATEETARRDAEAARLRSKGWAYRRIAAEMGYESHTSAMDAVQRALDAIREEPAQQVKQLELERLDAMYDAVMKVLDAKHFTVSQGRLINIDDEPLEDDAPVLAAVDRLLKIQARRAALLGLDAPQRVEQGGKLTYEIVGVSLDQL
jgi:hypothetical protein